MVQLMGKEMCGGTCGGKELFNLQDQTSLNLSILKILLFQMSFSRILPSGIYIQFTAGKQVNVYFYNIFIFLITTSLKETKMSSKTLRLMRGEVFGNFAWDFGFIPEILLSALYKNNIIKHQTDRTFFLKSNSKLSFFFAAMLLFDMSQFWRPVTLLTPMESIQVNTTPSVSILTVC